MIFFGPVCTVGCAGLIIRTFPFLTFHYHLAVINVVEYSTLAVIGVKTTKSEFGAILSFVLVDVQTFYNIFSHSDNCTRILLSAHLSYYIEHFCGLS